MNFNHEIEMTVFYTDMIIESEKNIIKWNTFLLNTSKDINKSLVKALKREKKRKENYEKKLYKLLEQENG